MTPQEFLAKWRPVTLSERSACQSHAGDLCTVLGQPQPVAADPKGEWYTFERGVRKTSGGHGWADVWMQGKFGWEYKKKRRNLDAAYQQLLLYREYLENPPLLVICDLDRRTRHRILYLDVTRYNFRDRSSVRRSSSVRHLLCRDR